MSHFITKNNNSEGLIAKPSTFQLIRLQLKNHSGLALTAMYFQLCSHQKIVNASMCFFNELFL